MVSILVYFLQSRPYWIKVKQNATVSVVAIGDIIQYIRQRKGKNIVRWLGSNLPSFLFPNPTPRICVLMQGVNYAASDQIINPKQIRAAPSELEDFNDEGIIIAYAKTSDTDSVTLDTEADADHVQEFSDIWTCPNVSLKFHPR